MIDTKEKEKTQTDKFQKPKPVPLNMKQARLSFDEHESFVSRQNQTYMSAKNATMMKDSAYSQKLMEDGASGFQRIPQNTVPQRVQVLVNAQQRKQAINKLRDLEMRRSMQRPPSVTQMDEGGK